MKEYTFLYKVNNDDRDRFAYIQNEELHCGIDNRITIHGACYCSRIDENLQYEDITTVLSKEEFEYLRDGNYGDFKCENVETEISQRIINKLLSEENENLFAELIEEEKEEMKYEYGLDDEDIETIYDGYYLDYMDQSILGYVYDNVENLAENLIDECYNVDNNLKYYIDYEKFGNDLLSNDEYIELSDGRVCSMCY